MYPDPQRLEDISSIRDAMRQISLEAQAVVELLDVRLQDEHLDGTTEAEDVRSVLELIQSLTLKPARTWMPTRSGSQAREATVTNT
jgi:hypothetical protein